MVAAGGGPLHVKGEISLSAAVVAPGLMVQAIILFMGAVCAFVLRGKGGSSISRAAGSGILDPGSRCARQVLADEIDAGEVDPSASTPDRD
jgi:hypothetical protein